MKKMTDTIKVALVICILAILAVGVIPVQADEAAYMCWCPGGSYCETTSGQFYKYGQYALQ